jgi:hypothetical protein
MATHLRYRAKAGHSKKCRRKTHQMLFPPRTISPHAHPPRPHRTNAQPRLRPPPPLPQHQKHGRSARASARPFRAYRPPSHTTQSFFPPQNGPSPLQPGIETGRHSAEARRSASHWPLDSACLPVLGGARRIPLHKEAMGEAQAGNEAKESSSLTNRRAHWIHARRS